MNKTPQILIVDDQKSTCELIENQVRSFCNYEVASRSNSTQAITFIGNHHVDLILMDIKLGEKSTFDGIDTAKLIASKYSIPIIFLTAINDSTLFIEKNLPMFIDVLLKPFDATLLKLHIEIMLQNGIFLDRCINYYHCFRGYLSLKPNPLYITDEDGSVIFFNDNAEVFSACSKSAIYNNNLLDILQLSFLDGGFLLGFKELITNARTNKFLISTSGKPQPAFIKIEKFIQHDKKVCYSVEIQLAD